MSGAPSPSACSVCPVPAVGRASSVEGGFFFVRWKVIGMQVEYRFRTFSGIKTRAQTGELSTVKRIFDTLGGDVQWFSVKYPDGRKYWYTDRDGWRLEPARPKNSART